MKKKGSRSLFELMKDSGERSTSAVGKTDDAQDKGKIIQLERETEPSPVKASKTSQWTEPRTIVLKPDLMAGIAVALIVLVAGAFLVGRVTAPSGRTVAIADRGSRIRLDQLDIALGDVTREVTVQIHGLSRR